jgi:acetyl-CoA carboxylase biotin carboxyl carrier protein
MSSRKEQLNDSRGVARARSRNTDAVSDQPSASVNMDELKELIGLVRENGLAELELERAGFRVRLRREGTTPLGYSESIPQQSLEAQPTKSPAAATPVGSAPPSHPGARAETAASEDQDLHIIPSPIVGTFYRSPSPNADPFVKIGSNVEPETIVCIIEAMKLMNEIQAETSGEVVKVYVENGQPVEYGQPLFGIKS